LDGLRYEAAPKVEGEEWVEAAEASNEVAFEDVDGFFRGVGAMVVRGYELVLGVLFLDEALEGGRSFVVESGNDGLEATVFEVFEEGGVAADEFAFGAGFKGFGEDGVGVVVKEDH